MRVAAELLNYPGCDLRECLRGVTAETGRRGCLFVMKGRFFQLHLRALHRFSRFEIWKCDSVGTNWEKKKKTKRYMERKRKGFGFDEMKESVVGGSGVGYIGRYQLWWWWCRQDFSFSFFF
ncbi:hypothetical protein V8G54_006802 [Vigna mungo]|uniref:Uncharacterized protein n=1 Tax=Vigna mungo TaxID=3915 RepID=A0AAQ3P244_VIGMU